MKSSDPNPLWFRNIRIQPTISNAAVQASAFNRAPLPNQADSKRRLALSLARSAARGAVVVNEFCHCVERRPTRQTCLWDLLTATVLEQTEQFGSDVLGSSVLGFWAVGVQL